MMPPFAPVSRRTVTDEVRLALLASIRDGRLAPGDPIPAERVLGEQFGVARTSVREALQHLVSAGVVERRGNRTLVVDRLPELDLTHTDDRKRRVHQLFETRRLIELPMVELAACRATTEQREDLVALAAHFRPNLPLDEFRRLDHAFHGALADSSGNELLAEVYGKVLAALFSDRAFDELLHAPANRHEVAVIVERAGEDHAAIAQAFAAGDPVAVMAATESHLSDVESRMIERLA